MEFHRVYARWDDHLWLGVSEYLKRRDLTPKTQYATLQVNRPGGVCFVLATGHRICDFGPEHVHD